MAYDIRIWSVGGKSRASVNWQGESLFGEAETPALALIELGFYWQRRIDADKEKTD